MCVLDFEKVTIGSTQAKYFALYVTILDVYVSNLADCIARSSADDSEVAVANLDVLYPGTRAGIT